MKKDCVRNSEKPTITSKTLKKEMDIERGDHLPEINGIGNTYARMDKSFSNSIDFFVKLSRRGKKKEK